MAEDRAPPADKPEKPHFHGHRDRLKKRFLAGGPEALAEYELLELLLFLAIPRRDVKEDAKKLIAEFGGLARVFAAEPEELARRGGLGEGAVVAIKAVQAAALHLMRSSVLKQPVISSWRVLLDYCKAAMAHDRIEQFRVLYLDRKNRLMADEKQQRGTVDHTPVYPREVVKRALELGASAIIMVHNHPSGDATPSRADIEMTKEVAKAASALGIALHDHVVIGQGEPVSFKSLGLL